MKMLEIKIEKNESSMIFYLTGRLDTNTAPDLETELKNSGMDTETLIFDLTDLEFISSAGLRVLLASQKKMTASQHKMIIRNASEAIVEIFEITGMTMVFDLE